MELLNEMIQAKEAGAYGTPEWNETIDIYLRMLAPVAPHIAEELWTNHLGKPYSIHQQSWPKFDESAAKEDSIELPVQITGKRGNAVLVGEDDWRAVQETLHLVSIPGMRESILEGMATPVDELADELDW
mgnify:CR=1 FL=1